MKLKNCIPWFLFFWASCPASGSQWGIAKANSFDSVKGIGKLDAQRRLQQIVLQDILATAKESTQLQWESSKPSSLTTVQENSFVRRKLEESVTSGAFTDTTKPTLQKTLKFTSGSFTHTTTPTLQQTLKVTSRSTAGSFTHTSKPNIEQTLKVTSRSAAGGFTHTTKPSLQQTLKVTPRPTSGLPFGLSCYNMSTPLSCNKTNGCKWTSSCLLKFDNCSDFNQDQSSCSAAKNCVWQAGPSYSLCFSSLNVCNNVDSLAMCNANSLCTWYSGCGTMRSDNNSGSGNQSDLCGSLLFPLQLDGMPLSDLILPALHNLSNFCSPKNFNQAVQRAFGSAWQSFSNNTSVAQALSCYYNATLLNAPLNDRKEACSSQAAGTVPCDKHCSSTSGSCNTFTGECSQCMTGFVVNSTGGCQPTLACDRRCSPAPTSCNHVTGLCLNCTIPFVASKGLCFPQQKCNPRCASGFCDVLTGMCTKCSTGFNLVSGNCVPQLTCSPNCQSTACNGTTGRCSGCKSGSFLDGKGICLRAQTCDARCKTCNQMNGNCTVCHSGYRPSGSPASCKLTQTCKNCITCDTLTGLCSQCSDGYSLNSGSCVINAQCDMHCKANSCNVRNGSCTQCNDGYLSNAAGRCQKTQKCDLLCDSSACNPVTGACSLCTGHYRATPTGVCQQTYKCNSRCSPVEGSCDVLTGICNNCSTGFVLSPSGACLTKQSCDSNCNSSFCNPLTGICKLCKAGFSTTPVGLCQKQQTCDNHCSSCDRLTGMCSECTGNYVLNAGICIQKRACSLSCNSTFCNLGNGFCTKCVNGYQDNAYGNCTRTSAVRRRLASTCNDGYVSNAHEGCQLKLNCSQHCSVSTGSCNYLDGSCSTCTGSYVANADGGCQPRLNCSQHCSSNSSACDPLTGQCSTCVPPYVKNAAGGCQLGQNCTGNCTKCDMATGECQQCSSTSVRNAAGACQPKAACSSTCQNCSYLTGECYLCAADYIANDIGGCQYKLNCTNCASGYCNFLTGACTQCLSGYAPRNGLCQTQQNCSSQCLSSACDLGTGICSNCTSEYVLNPAGACIPKQICSQNCSSCDFTNGICRACAIGYTPNAAGICQEKVSCSEFCPDDSCDPISGMCLQCQAGYYTTVVGGCVPNANCSSQCLTKSCDYFSGACSECNAGFSANLAGICAAAQSCSTGCASCNPLTGECSDCEDVYELRAGNCFAKATAVPTIRPTSKSQVSSSPTIAATSKPQASPATSKPQGVTPPIVFSLQLSGVTVASLNNNTIKSKIISSIATVFKVAASQVNVTVVASGSRRLSRILNTESVNLQVTIANLTAQQATTVKEIINSPRTQTELQESIRKSSPALSAVTVVSLTAGYTKQPTSKTSLKYTRQPTKTTISIELTTPATSNSLSERDKKIIGGVVGGVCGAVLVALAIWLLKGKYYGPAKSSGGLLTEVKNNGNNSGPDAHAQSPKDENGPNAKPSEVRNSLNANDGNGPNRMYQVFSLQLSGVTVASLNDDSIKSIIISSIATVFKVAPVQVNVTVDASRSRRSSRIPNTESEIVLVTITGLDAQQAMTLMESISSKTAPSQLQASIRSHSSSALSAVTVLSLTGVAPPIAFFLQLSGVTVASLNDDSIKSVITSSIATVFKVAAAQVNVTVVTSGSRRSSSIPNTESEIVLATITDLTAQQATTLMESISSSTAASQLQASIRKHSSSALSAVTVLSLTGVTPPIVFSLQLSGVTLASLNDDSIKRKISRSIATVFKVVSAQVNVTVVTSGSRRSSSIPSTESEIVLAAITDLTDQQATTLMEIVSSPAAPSQLQESIRKHSSPALSAVTVHVVSLTVSSDDAKDPDANNSADRNDLNAMSPKVVDQLCPLSRS